MTGGLHGARVERQPREAPRPATTPRANTRPTGCRRKFSSRIPSLADTVARGAPAPAGRAAWRTLATACLFGLLSVPGSGAPPGNRVDPAAPGVQTQRAAIAAALSPTLLQRPHPFLACTPEELDRLRTVLRDRTPGCEILDGRIARAAAALETLPVFPPRGARHNQWYQCDRCQVALVTETPTRHRCPTCHAVYQGPPYDDVVFARQHARNFQALLDCAWAWALTGERPYADRAAALLIGYGQRYRGYPHRGNTRWNFPYAWITGGRLFDQTLSEASTMVVSLAPAYDLVHDSGALSKADHQTVREGLFEPMLRGIERNFLNRGNWHAWHNAALLWGGAMLGDAARVNRSIRDPRDGFYYHLACNVSPEGFWRESSWGYHGYALQALTAQAEGARRLDLDLWSAPRLRDMFTLPAAFVMADGSLPRFGDDVRSVAVGHRDLAEAAWQATRDPAVLTLLPDTPSWDSLLLGRHPGVRPPTGALGSRVFPLSGYAVLRAGGPAGMTAAMTFGPDGGFHSHFDKLGFVWFAFGRECGVDPGRATSQAYRLPIHHDWYRATLSHNTVMVDGRSQAPANGALERFAGGDGWTAVAARCDAAYPGVRHRRLLLMTGAFLLVADDLRADRPHAFQWLCHQRARTVASPDAPRAGAWPEAGPGGAYVRQVRTGASDDGVRARFHDPEVSVNLMLAADGHVDAITGEGPFTSADDLLPFVAVTRRAGYARFAAVLEPIPADRNPTVTGIAIEPQPDRLLVRIEMAEQPTAEIVWDSTSISANLKSK